MSRVSIRGRSPNSSDAQLAEFGSASNSEVLKVSPGPDPEFMKTIWTITKRELYAYFTSPVAYVFLVIFLLLTGFFTFTAGNFFERGEASLAAFFGWHPWVYLVLVPAVGMRVWREERRSGTIELLLTLPVAPWQAIVAKFLASWIFLAVALALTFPAVITVNILGEPDNGIIFAGYLGSFFLAGAYLAITLHDLRHDAKPGRGIHPVGGDLPLLHPRRLQPGDGSA